MKAAGPARDEDRRIRALHALDVLDTAPDERFDWITRLACRVFDVPIALVSLVDRDRVWFKSSQGFDSPEAPRDVSFCAHALLGRGTLVVPDALRDERFHDNPLVTGPPGVRFYAGYPLEAPDGTRLGAFCIADRRPRELDSDQLAVLGELGRAVEAELALLGKATLDELTGLANRRGFARAADGALTACRSEHAPACVLVLDLVHLRGVNEHFGYAEGNRVLCEAASLLEDAFPQSDNVARLGGHELGVLLTGEAVRDVPRALERLHSNTALRNLRTDSVCPLEYTTAQVAFDPERHRSVRDLLDAVDRELERTRALPPSQQGSAGVAPPGPEPREWLAGGSGALLGCLLVALGYWLTGRLGVLLAIEPGYATAVWPPSGVALAALLLLGSRVWPGVFLGSFALNLGISLRAEGGLELERALAIAACLGVGASLQAVLGASLIRRCVGFPTPLERARDVVAFLVLGGPVACLVNASAGPLALWWFGMFPPEAVAFTWWTWWIGDCIGVLIFTPLVLIYAPAPTGSAWQQRRALVGLPLAATFAIYVAVFAHVGELEHRQLITDFEKRASAFTEIIRTKFDSHTEALRSLAGFYAASRVVRREEFRTYAEHLLGHRPGLRGVGWLPRVGRADRTVFEASARAEGLPGFRILQRAEGGGVTPAADRAEYFPLFFAEPLDLYAEFLGFDMASESKRGDTLARARASGNVAASTPLRLLRSEHDPSGILLALPVPELDAPATAPRLRGFVVTAWTIREVVEAAARQADGGVLVRVREVGSASDARPLYESPGLTDRDPTWQTEIDIGGRTWQLSFHPSQAYLVEQRTWISWFVLAGSLLLSSLLGSFLLVLTGRSQHTQALVHERTAQLERAVRAQQREQNKVEALLEATPDAMVMVDMNNEIRLVNGQTEELFGYRRPELLGRNLALLIPDRFRNVHARRFAEFTVAPRVLHLGMDEGLTAVRKDGSEFPVEISLRPLATEEGTVVLSAIRDVSARRQAQQDLADRTQALARSNEELERFAYVASHDLQEPLRIVASYTQLLAKRYEGQLDAEAQQFIAYAVDGAQRMRALIRDLLELSRVNTRGAELAPVELGSAYDWAIWNLRMAIEESGARVTCDPLPRVMGDHGQLGHVLQNLLSNALKFCASTPPEIHVAVRHLGDYWQVRVRDNGIGIPSDQQARIWQVFQRLHDRERYPGTGIGLAICKKVVQRHGGEVGVESEPAKGSTFWFTVRAARDG